LPSAPPLSSASPSCPSPASTNATCLARPDSSRFVPRDSSLQLGGVKRNFLYCPKRNFSLCRDTTGGTIALRGADEYDSLRGEGLDFVVLDEFASMAP